MKIRKTVGLYCSIMFCFFASVASSALPEAEVQKRVEQLSAKFSKLSELGYSGSNILVFIDFTGSNNFGAWIGTRYVSRPHPIYGSSLHADKTTTPHKINPYEQAIEAVVGKLGELDDDGHIFLYGFGSKGVVPPKPNDSQQRVFNIVTAKNNANNSQVYSLDSLQDDFSYVSSVKEALEAYQIVRPRIEYWGPTTFVPAIHKTIETVRKEYQQTGQYKHTIAVIISDGDITDNLEKENFDAFADATQYPISFITIGVGPSDFKDLHKIDDVSEHTSHDVRFDNAQQVVLREGYINENPTNLSLDYVYAKALWEIPDQFEAMLKQKLLVVPD